MALVFKIKHRETLRRWVVSPTVPEHSHAFPLTVKDLEEKVRKLFQFAADEVLIITYLDKEGDVVTVADNQDLWDACMVQGLNPLRLDVQIDEIKHNPNVISAARQSSPTTNWVPHVSSPLPSPQVHGDSNCSSKPPFPQVTADAIKQFLNKYSQTIDPNLQPAVILSNIQKALKDFVKTVVREGQRLAPRVAPPGRSPTYSRCASEPPPCHPSENSTHPVVHVGVECDECNTSPIKGVRYKSIKVFNYDLCADCFAKIGNESDYQKLDKPVSFVHPAFYHPSCSKGPNIPMRWAVPFASGTDGWKSECPFLRTKSGCPPTDVSKELDASIVKELPVFDGGEVIPGMDFQWTIHLRNNGSKPWPQGTKFIYLSGKKLTAKLEVDLKLPAPGLPVGLDVEICLDMNAPDTAGNYISHWCLAAPSGERFGRTVWLAIHVVSEPQGSSGLSPDVQLACDEVDGGKVGAGQQVSDVESTIEPVAVTPLEVDMGIAGSQMKKQEVIHAVGQEENAEKKGTQLPDAVVLAEVNKDMSDEVDGFSMIEKPVDDGGSLRKMMHAPMASSQLTFPPPTSAIREQYTRMCVEEIGAQDMNLRRLDAMGFFNHDLNAVLLEKNKQDLQLTLDDLLLGSGWDNLLKDLLEMGFTDTHTNLRLLIKNGGSLKRVVKELIELEKY